MFWRRTGSLCPTRGYARRSCSIRSPKCRHRRRGSSQTFGSRSCWSRRANQYKRSDQIIHQRCSNQVRHSSCQERKRCAKRSSFEAALTKSICKSCWIMVLLSTAADKKLYLFSLRSSIKWPVRTFMLSCHWVTCSACERVEASAPPIKACFIFSCKD